MNLIKKNNILKRMIIFFILPLFFSCSKNVDHNKKVEKVEKVEKVLYDFHEKNSSKELKTKVELLATKNIGLKYKGLFYKMKNSNKFYCGFIDNNNNIIKTIELKKGETVTLLEDSLCLTPFDNRKETVLSKKKNEYFTLFIGEIPYDGYSSIELKWNCSSSDNVSEKLINQKYFFFLKKGMRSQICNIKLRDNDGRTDEVIYYIEEGIFKKRITADKMPKKSLN